MSTPRLLLCDPALPIVEAWDAYFSRIETVEIVTDDPASQTADALVLAVTSLGQMDGGPDRELLDILGEELPAEVYSLVTDEHGGELVVGCAEILQTLHPQFPFLVLAPVVRVPQNVSRTVNVYLGLRAALRAVLLFNSEHGDVISSVLVPALGVGVGQMPPLRCARQMRAAFDNALFNAPPNVDMSLDAAVDGDDKLAVRKSEAQKKPGE